MQQNLNTCSLSPLNLRLFRPCNVFKQKQTEVSIEGSRKEEEEEGASMAEQLEQYNLNHSFSVFHLYRQFSRTDIKDKAH